MVAAAREHRETQTKSRGFLARAHDPRAMKMKLLHCAIRTLVKDCSLFKEQIGAMVLQLRSKFTSR